jgi:propanediol utilization protein
MMTAEQTDRLADALALRLREALTVPVEASARHIHLSKQDIVTLYGAGYQLTNVRPLSQPGQYVCAERLTLEGSRGTVENVVVLGPARSQTQVEISLTDARILGINPPIRLSGDLAQTPGITIRNPQNGAVLSLSEGVIVAKRHIHMTPHDAARFHVKNAQSVRLKIASDRPLVFDDVEVRVSDSYATYAHIDYDEANACGFTQGMRGRVIRCR